MSLHRPDELGGGCRRFHIRSQRAASLAERKSSVYKIEGGKIDDLVPPTTCPWRTLSPLTATLTGHVGTVTGVAFSPDGHTLATASADTPARLWDLSKVLELSGHLISWSCAATGGGLTREQWTTFAPGIPYRPTC